MFPRPYDDDDGLQAWLAGRPAWPLTPAAHEAATSLAVRVTGDDCHLRAAARACATRAAELEARGDAQGARHERSLLRALDGELHA